MLFAVEMCNINKILICISLCLSTAFALECYVCENQDTNTEKCIKTLKMCNVGETMCLSTVKWAGTPYWEINAKKQYYISKRCASKQECSSTIHRSMPRCRRLWYEDWECAECCQGNRCNFFVTLGSSLMKSSLILTSSLLAFSIGFMHLFR